MTTLEHPTPGTDTAGDADRASAGVAPQTQVLLDEMEDCIAAIRKHGDGILEEVRAFGRLMLGAPAEPGHRIMPASRIPRLVQVIHEGGWWNVESVAADADGVTLVLTRIGYAPLEITVPADTTFETAEIF